MDILTIDTENRRDVKRFLDFPFQLYRDVPQWVPPFDSDARRMLDRTKHPFYQHSTAEFFLAVKDDRVVGRLAVLDHRPYNEWNHSQTAFIYLFESENDPDASRGLFNAAFEWAQKRGLTQEALAAKVDIHRVHLARIESAVRTPSVEMLEKLAKALKVTVGELVE